MQFRLSGFKQHGAQKLSFRNRLWAAGYYLKILHNFEDAIREKGEIGDLCTQYISLSFLIH